MLERPLITMPDVARLEDRWLIAAVQHALLGLEVVHPPATGVDWPFLLRQASLHAALPSLGSYCEERSDEVPERVLKQLREEQAHVRAYNFFLLQELSRVTHALAAEQVQVLAWKGPALAAAIYADIGMRQCADLDLLIRPAQMETAVALLQRLGYREMKVDTGGHTRNLERDSPKTVVELHQLVVQPHFSLPLETPELFVKAVKIPTFAGNIVVPSPEKLLLLLCVHGAKHVWERLAWVCDLVLFIRAHPHLDWLYLRQCAVKCRGERMLNIGLLMAELLCTGILPPEEALKVEMDADARKLSFDAWNWMFISESSHTLSFRRAWFQIAMRENAKDRCRLLRHLFLLAVTPGEVDRSLIHLPRSLSFAYYLVRPLRLSVAIFFPQKHSEKELRRT
jgi:hypothetical protein